MTSISPKHSQKQTTARRELFLVRNNAVATVERRAAGHN